MLRGMVCTLHNRILWNSGEDVQKAQFYQSLIYLYVVVILVVVFIVFIGVVVV